MAPPLKDLSEQVKSLQKPDHLAGWLAKGKAGRKSMGITRLHHTQVLYIYLVLGLEARYSEKLRGKVERIDQAFAEYLRRDENSIKKIRNSLYMSLPRPGSAVPSA